MQYHWTPSEQSARNSETVDTTLVNLMSTINTTVSIIVFVLFSSYLRSV
jgi:hypothetical protein